MTTEHQPSPSPRTPEGLPPAATSPRRAGSETRGSGGRRVVGLCLALLGLTSCGGGNPLDNPPLVNNEVVIGGQKLSFEYFQKCINPILVAQLPIPGSSLTNTCAAGGCHDSVSGSGGSLRITLGAQMVTVGSPPDVDAIHATDMYRNFKSAQGRVVFSDPATSLLVTKPLVQSVLHGGGRIFANDQDPNVKLIFYWMTHPAAQGQDEFSSPAPATC